MKTPVYDGFMLKFWNRSGAEVCTSCRSWKMLSNAYFLAKFGFDPYTYTRTSSRLGVTNSRFSIFNFQFSIFNFQKFTIFYENRPKKLPENCPDFWGRFWVCGGFFPKKEKNGRPPPLRWPARCFFGAREFLKSGLLIFSRKKFVKKKLSRGKKLPRIWQSLKRFQFFLY